MLVIYHADCLDGFAAAYAAWTVYGDMARYVPAHYGDPLPEIGPAEEVLVVDFSWPRDTIERIRAEGRRVCVIDHHKTAAAALAGLADCVFDMERSGCTLAWQHLRGRKPVPQLLLYVEDRDLWRWALPGTREVCLGLQLVPLRFQEWDNVVHGADDALRRLREAGTAIQAYQERRMMPDLLALSRRRVLDGFRCREVNSPVLASELGGALAKQSAAEGGAPVGVVWSVTADGRVRVSLRSTGDFDVSAIAAAHGGGGHRNAAGFTVAAGEWIRG